MQVELEENTLKLFNTYSYTEVSVNDTSLKPYININPEVSYPHTASRHNKYKFGKGKIPILERFICTLMRRGKNNGKKELATKAVKDAFTIIHTITKSNPLQVLVDALINAGPREDCARVGKGGAMRRTSVDVSALRRLNVAIFLLGKGIRQSARKCTKTIAECIADELIPAAKNSPNSFAVKKKDEIERMAKSNR
ncbi:ribosomal S7 [Tubulinosema ratisbonensis]|uniref:Ribosomal S7 n=1 Tax=Tubulinosema ratisbonensis TaxID=291195 RepID=A0A437ALE8_9MICR|nr:ribosomal S7 [Tubulinosema ratisbonensis]